MRLLVSLGFINLINFNSCLLNEGGEIATQVNDLQSLYNMLWFYFSPISKIHAGGWGKAPSPQRAGSCSN